MKLEQLSIPIWIIKKGIQNEKGQKIEFKDHLFLYDIYRDISPRQVIKKCSQVGLSVALNLKSHFLAKNRGLQIIYTMPSDTDVEEFVKTKADKIINANPEILSEISSNNVFLKEIGNSFIIYKGTRSKTAPISTTADLIIHDEYDRSDLDIAGQYGSRITTSKFKGVWKVSNPSLAGIGVDEEWKLSDQKEWYIKCKGCGKEQKLVWEENVDTIRGEYVCKFCNKILTDNERRLGKWVKENPKGEISGYHISQMMAPWMSAKDMIREKDSHSLDYFYNFMLGEPFKIGEEVSFRTAITDGWTNKPLDQEPFFMGIDIGKVKHYVLGSSKGIFKIGEVKSREQVEEILNRYNPVCVMDAGPERTWAEEFKQKYPKLSLCFFGRDKNQKELVRFGGDKGTEDDLKNIGYIYADRNRVIDKVIYEILEGKMLFGLSRDDLERYIRHWETLRRVIEVAKDKTERYVWTSTTGQDHYCFATIMYWIAKLRSASSISFLEDVKEKKEIVIMTEDGPVMRPLEEILEEQNE